MDLEKFRSDLRDRNSRFKPRIYEGYSTSDLVRANKTFLSSDMPDFEIASLIHHEIQNRNSKDKNKEIIEAWNEIKNQFKDYKIKPIEWLNRARSRMQLLHNAPDQHGTFCVYVILMNWLDPHKNYGVYVGQTRKQPEERFMEHKAGIRAGRGVELRGTQLMWSLMPYSDNLLMAHSRKKYEGAVHHCLATVKAKGFKSGLLKVGGDGKNENPDEWPGAFQNRLRQFLRENQQLILES